MSLIEAYFLYKPHLPTEITLLSSLLQVHTLNFTFTEKAPQTITVENNKIKLSGSH